MRAERKWRRVKRGGSKVTEMLKDERGGSEIISHYKLRERDTPCSSSAYGARTEQLCSSPASPELSHTFPLFLPVLPLCTGLIYPEMP